MPSCKIEKFVRATADYTLRECYKRLGNLQLAEEAFIEVYVAWYKTRFMRCKICKFIDCYAKWVLEYEHLQR